MTKLKSHVNTLRDIKPCNCRISCELHLHNERKNQWCHCCKIESGHIDWKFTTVLSTNDRSLISIEMRIYFTHGANQTVTWIFSLQFLHFWYPHSMEPITQCCLYNESKNFRDVSQRIQIALHKMRKNRKSKWLWFTLALNIFCRKGERVYKSAFDPFQIFELIFWIIQMHVVA